MKIIDKNGKLFGKVNMLDLVIVLVIIIAGLFIVNKFSINGNDTTVTSSAKKQIYLVAEAYKQAPDVAESIVQGDTLVSQNKYQNGKIDYVNIRDNDYLSTTIDGKLVASKNPLLKTIEVGIKCQGNVNGPYIDSGGQELKVGLPYWIKTSKGQIRGFIKEIKIEE
ncbi:MAG: DUF4330 domain-containing protein [Vallitalea sp.]|jgi:uncharacterized protein (UPF0333 family)|nr:DUF4330 domain-containing protein [Vallitalea sp.]